MPQLSLPTPTGSDVWGAQVNAAIRNNDPRSLFLDECVESALPSGASISGGTTYDATDLRRQLVGASTYTSAAVALRGTLVAEADIEILSATNTSNLEFKVMKGTSVVARIAFQSDNNVVIYDASGTPRGNMGSGSANVIGMGLSLGLSVSAATSECAAIIAPLAGGSWMDTGKTNGGNVFGVQSMRWTSGLSGLAAGDSLTVQLTQDAGSANRTTAFYKVSATNGRRRR